MLDITGKHTNNFLYCGLQVGEGNQLDLNADSQILHDWCCSRYGHGDHIGYYTSRLCVQGNEYCPGDVILFLWEDYMPPNFGIVERIIIYRNDQIFVINVLETCEYVWQANSYRVMASGTQKVLTYAEIQNKFTLQLVVVQGKSLVMAKYSGWLGGVYISAFNYENIFIQCIAIGPFKILYICVVSEGWCGLELLGWKMMHLY